MPRIILSPSPTAHMRIPVPRSLPRGVVPMCKLYWLTRLRCSGLKSRADLQPSTSQRRPSTRETKRANRRQRLRHPVLVNFRRAPRHHIHVLRRRTIGKGHDAIARAGLYHSGGSATFTWTAGTGVTQYSVYIGSTPGAHDIHYVNAKHALSTSVTGLPSDGGTIYVTLYSLIAASTRAKRTPTSLGRRHAGR